MIRLIIEISRSDRPPWQSITTRAEVENADLSEKLTANRFARIAWELLKAMHDESQTDPMASERPPTSRQAPVKDPNLGSL
jgi:hypothetical protein